MLSVFIPQETKEAKKSFNKKDEEHILSGREKRLAEQVSSYNVSQNKIYNFLTFFLSFSASRFFFCLSELCWTYIYIKSFLEYS